jgi:NTE family protein
MQNNRPQIGLALGGGAVRGLAHLGVLQTLERNKVPIDCVAGTSVGSVVGAAYCAGLSIEQILELAQQTGWRQLSGLAWPWQGLFSFAKLERWIIDLLGDLTFDDLAIPLTVVATDMEREEVVRLKKGRVAPAVRASCSIPGIVTPVKINGRLLNDGFVTDNLPVAVVRQMGAAYVIAVDVCRPAPRRRMGPLGHIFWAIEIMARRAGGGVSTADCLISPDLAGFSYVRFSQREELIRRGAEVAQAEMQRLRQDLDLEHDTLESNQA